MNVIKVFLLIILFQTNFQAYALGDPIWFYKVKYEPENKTANVYSYNKELKELKKLLDKGYIDKNEFETIKHKIIEKIK